MRIANHNMINALKLISIDRGYDPREFSLMAYGGGGGLHACELAQELGFKEVIIPVAASVFSALGMLMCDLQRDYVLTKIISLSATNVIEQINSELINIEKSIIYNYAKDNIKKDEIHFEHFGCFRYQNQEHVIELKLPTIITNTDQINDDIEAFHAAYQRRYTYKLDCPVEFVRFHTAATVNMNKLNPKKRALSNNSSDQALIHSRPVNYLLAGVHSTPVFNAELLEPDLKLKGLLSLKMHHPVLSYCLFYQLNLMFMVIYE